MIDKGIALAMIGVGPFYEEKNTIKETRAPPVIAVFVKLFMVPSINTTPRLHDLDFCPSRQAFLCLFKDGIGFIGDF